MSSIDELVATGLVEPRRSLAQLTTYKLGGAARWFCEVGDEDELQQLVVAIAGETPPPPIFVLGRGSNVVISDRGIDGVVLRLGGDFMALTIPEEPVAPILAGGAVALPRLARESVRAGRGGLEFFIGIPGSVGGAIRMNAGCRGSDTAGWLLSARIMDLASGVVDERVVEELDFGYRRSAVGDGDLVVSARFRTEPSTPEAGEAVLRDITRWRRDAQPGGTLNAGSVFKNPPGDAAGRIIDELGLKGFTVGGAAVSEKHANFFVAAPHATAQDVHDLVMAVRRRVHDLTGTWLEPEIRFVGDFDAPPERAGDDHPTSPRDESTPA